jgi:glycosyltransferase involved in cell wall biosynthesis
VSFVSVVIPAYNAASYVRGAVESVLRQSHQDFEIVIVDDGSTDNTKQVVEPYLSDPRIRYRYQENRGLPGARNSGASQSQGEYLAFLDADDFFAPNALQSMLSAFQLTKAAWLNVGVLKISGDSRTVRHPVVPSADLGMTILNDDFITRSPFYPRHEFFAIGMYDEEIRVREDWDINIRMILAGRPFATVDQPLYEYTRTEGSLTTSNRKRLYAYTEKLLRKHHKRIADAGDKEVGRIYARNMWDLGRQYFREIHDPREALRCACESLRYDMSLHRVVHPLIRRMRIAFGSL